MKVVLTVAGCLLLTTALTAWSEQVTITTSATRVGSVGLPKRSLILKSPAGATTVYCDDTSDVTATDDADKGAELAAGEGLSFEDLTSREGVWCIIGAGTQKIQFIERTR